MKEKKQSDLSVLLMYAGSYKKLTFIGLGLSAIAMILGMLPYICIWLVVRDLIAVAPNWGLAVGIAKYGWMAFAFADPENEALIQKAFAVLTKDRTVIMIAHRLSTVIGVDKIIALNNGCVEEEGTHAELVKAGGLYSRMWKDYNQAVKWKISQGTPVKSTNESRKEAR